MTDRLRIEYLSDLGTRLLVANDTFQDNNVLWVREDLTAFRVSIFDFTGTTMTISVPLASISGEAQLTSQGILWQGTMYARQTTPFTGRFNTSEEDNEPRPNPVFAFNADLQAVFISAGSASNRVFIGDLNPDGGELTRVTVKNFAALQDGTFQIETPTLFIDTGDTPYWQPLRLENYNFVETDYRVIVFRRM